MKHVKSDVFLEVAKLYNGDIDQMAQHLREFNPKLRKYKIAERLLRYRRLGILPLDSGNKVSTGEVLRGTSTMYDSEGQVVLQWVKSDVHKSQQLDFILEAIQGAAQSITPLPSTPQIAADFTDLATLYLSNDVHLGALVWDKETGEDYSTEIAVERLRAAYHYLFSTSPNSKIGIIVDLGDLTEANDDKNMTPKSGNILAVDSRYPKVLRCAYECLIYAIQMALTKHEIVYFINVEGNHDPHTATAVREVIRIAFKNEPRVIIDEDSKPIKYFQHGQTLLQFAHGDAMKMKQAGEVMAVDCEKVFSTTKFRFSHFGQCGRLH